MKIIKVKLPEKQANPKRIDPQKMYDTLHAKVMHVTFQPGEAQAKHVNRVAVLFYILEGNGRIEVNDDVANIEKGSVIESPANSQHCLYNDGDSIMRVLVIKTPNTAVQKK